MKQVVIGLGFGDEGKGLVVDWLARKRPNAFVVRYSGGHQVGHCVRTEDKMHIFSNFGSGTMSGNETLWNAKTFDPVGFRNEWKVLEEKGITPRIIVHPSCPVTTPMDKIFNRKRDKELGHGSVGVGFGSTIQREEDNFHLTLRDLFHPFIFRSKLEMIKSYYAEKLSGIDPTELDNLINNFKLSCEFVKEKMPDLMDFSTKQKELNAIYESSQGILLDMDYGIFPHVTRSRLGTQEIVKELPLDTEFYLVTRAYQTRHGNGPCNTIVAEVENEGETNDSKGFQGLFKKRVLDLDVLRYAMTVDPIINASYHKNLVITCLDQFAEDGTDYILTDGDKGMFTFDTEVEFINHIVNSLPMVENVFVSHGPTAEDISLFEGHLRDVDDRTPRYADKFPCKCGHHKWGKPDTDKFTTTCERCGFEITEMERIVNYDVT